ncbi:MAG: hypothetical protein ACOC2W_01940 [bacterium]
MDIKEIINEELNSMLNTDNKLVICINIEQKNQNKIDFIGEWIEYLNNFISKKTPYNVMFFNSNATTSNQHNDWLVDMFIKYLGKGELIKYGMYENVLTAESVYYPNNYDLLPNSTPQSIKQNEDILIKFFNFIINENIRNLSDSHINKFMSLYNYNENDVQILLENKDTISNLKNIIFQLETYVNNFSEVELMGDMSSVEFYEILLVLKILDVDYTINNKFIF